MSRKLKPDPGNVAHQRCLELLEAVFCGRHHVPHVYQIGPSAVKFTGTAWFWVYEGNKSGYGCITRCGWQNHRKAETYIEELHAGFGHVERRGPLLICKLPKL